MALSDVVICGAGPVGLLAALGLARQGVAVTVLEAGAAVSPAPRANGYFPPTLDLLERYGLLEEAESIAYRSEIIHFRFPSTGAIIPMSMGVLEGQVAHPYFLHFGQGRLGEMIVERLSAMPNAEVRFGCEVRQVSQDDAGVTVTFGSPNGETRLRAPWLIGADGARSAVRRLIGVGFDGFTWPDRYVATNVWYDFEKHGFAPNNMIHDPVNWAIVTRLGPEPLWRVTFGEDADLPEDEVLRRIPERYAAILPGSDPYEIAAAAPYRVHERAATRFRQGRVLLAGDAAHACNPIGGMGLTSGAFDAQALSDVLGALLRGEVEESLLDVYAEERRKLFLEFASPWAQGHKRRIQEADPVLQRAGQDELQRISEDPVKVAMAQSAAFPIAGRSLLPARAL